MKNIRLTSVRSR